jgi:hypothetical protein
MLIRGGGGTFIEFVEEPTLDIVKELPWVGEEDGVFFEGTPAAECLGLMLGGVTLPPPIIPPDDGGLGLTIAPVEPGTKFLGDNFGETTGMLCGGYLGDTVFGGYFGEVIGPRTPDPDIWP